MISKGLLIFWLIFFWSAIAQGITGDITLTDKELLERLTRLEEGQKSLGQRFDDLKGSIDKRFDDLKEGTNQRFDDLNDRFNDLKESTNQRFDQILFWLELLFGTMVVMLAGIFTHGILLWRGQSRVETLIETHLRETEKDRFITMQSEEIKLLKERLDKLEQKVA